MTLKYFLFKRPGNIKELADRIEKRGLEKKVAFNVLTNDKINYIPFCIFFPFHKDCVYSRYSVIVSCMDDTSIYFKKKLKPGICLDSMWGISLTEVSPDPEKGTGINGIKEDYSKIKSEIHGRGFKIIQEYAPEFFR